ncbi:MAG: protein kinase, partial [Actinobacteria bacterium]|nr:protein kinase [Actinomycetota bacterium]
MSSADTTIAHQETPPRSEVAATVVLERYRLMRRLGAGAFGVVWLALDERLDRVVAVKRIEAHDPEMAARAEREAIAAARLNHPGIVALHEAGRDADAVYLVSELVRGRTLRERLVAGELSDRDVVRIGIALCDALSHAHARGVIHRDIKPANIIIPDRPDGDAGIVKLTDFGIALIAGDDALTRTGDVVGTLAYMAPEQADGSPVSGQSDLYSLALVLYEAFSGVN